MPTEDPIAARRLLVTQVRDLAIGVGLAIRTARALHLPVEPGVPAGRDALILGRTCSMTCSPTPEQ